MIKIYCLVDPRNNKPFYIGATKVLLKNRLSAHMYEARIFQPNKYDIQYYPAYKKQLIIKDLINSGLRPKIDLLYTCSLYSVEYYEAFFYKMLTKQGFELHNWPSQFNYSKYAKVDYYQFNENTSK